MKLFDKFWAWHAARPCEALIGPSHKYVDLHDGRWFDEYQNTGEYVDGKPIQVKYDVKIQKCTRCGQKNKIELRNRY